MGHFKKNLKATEAPCVILVEPQLGANIGTAARAMANFGLTELRLVAPTNGWPNEHAIKAASGADLVIEQAAVFDTLEEAVADLNYVVATTARKRDMVKPVLTPETAAEAIHERSADGQGAGILFGRERYGLTNDHVVLADALVIAPVNPDFASLNLAQAVLLIGYEWFKRKSDGGLGRETEVEKAAREGLAVRDSRPATRDELVGFFNRLDEELDKGGFLRPPEKRPAMLRNIHNMFTRANLTEQEVRTLHGMVSSLIRKHERG